MPIDLINKTPYPIQKNNDRTKSIGGHLFASLDGLHLCIARHFKDRFFFNKANLFTFKFIMQKYVE